MISPATFASRTSPSRCPLVGRCWFVSKHPACGHTDIHAAHGDWPVKPTLPLIPGHEGVGIVEELGAGVERLKIGDRVAMPWLGSACGVCEYCIDGWETLCKEQVNTGYGRDGSYAEYVTPMPPTSPQCRTRSIRWTPRR